MTTTVRQVQSELERGLHEFGIRALPASASESVPVSRVLEHPDALESFVARIRRWRQAGIPVCLSLTTDEPEVCRHWSEFSEQRQDVRRLTGLGFAIRSSWLPLHATCEALDQFFGAGPRFVFLENLCTTQAGEPATASHVDDSRDVLVNALRMRGLLPVYGGFVRSHCPLLPDEISVEVLPDSGLVVPAGSAWQCVSLPLAPLCDQRGEIANTTLQRVACDAVRFADDRIDRYRWPDETRQADAERNRRVAFILTGIGDFALRQKLDPRDFGALRHLSDVVGEIRDVLHRASGRLAAERGAVLSLDDAGPHAGWLDGSVGKTWFRHFEEARSRSLIRHRNLLAMSPYSVLPAGSPPPPAFADLLPLIGQADAWCFSGAPSFTGWNPGQYRDFHRRARAVIHGSQGHSRGVARI
jgi:hypothetical protein